MKKLSYLVSAVAAVFAANAHADVSVSGSADAGYLSDVTGDGRISIGSGVVFGLSTTTANGIGMSTGLSITVDQDGDNACWCWWWSICDFHYRWCNNRSW